MNQNELLLCMAYTASQIAQSTLPKTQYTGSRQTDEKSSFQSLLDEKRTQAGQTDSDPAEKPEQQSAADPTAQAAQAAAVLQGAAAVPNLEGQWAAAFLADGAQRMSGVQAVTDEAVLPETPVQTVQTPLADVQVQPQAQQAQPQTPAAAETAPAAELTAQPAVQPDQNQPVTAGQTSGAETAVQPEQTAAVNVPEDTQSAGQQQTQSQQQDQTDTPQVLQAQTGVTAQPLFQESESMPQRVGDAPVLDTQSQEFDSQLTGTVERALDQGSQRVEIKLTPEHLGNVVVEMTRSPEGALHVVLHAESEQAVKLLSEHSGTLGMMLQSGQNTEVRVEVQQPHPEEQHWQQPDQNGGQERQGQQQQQQRRQAEQSDAFLQQLRLGLVSAQTL